MKKARNPRPEIKVDLPDGYELEAGEVDNLVRAVFRKTLNMEGRTADLAIVNTLRDKNLRGVEAVRNVVRVSVEYVWDHWLGKPRNPTPSKLYHVVAPILILWYAKTTPAERRSAR